MYLEQILFPMTRVLSGFERALQQAGDVNLSVPHGQVVALLGKKSSMVSVWVLSKSVDRPYAIWQMRGLKGLSYADLVVIVQVMQMCRDGGFAIALRCPAGSPIETPVMHCPTVRLYSLSGVCLGGFVARGEQRIDVVGNFIVVGDGGLAFTVYALQSAAHAAALFAVKRSTFWFKLSSWQQESKFYFSHSGLYGDGLDIAEVDLAKVPPVVMTKFSSASYVHLLAVEQGDKDHGCEDCVIVKDTRSCCIRWHYASGRERYHFYGSKHPCSVVRWHPSVGCILQGTGRQRFHILWQSNENGLACQAFRMSCARKTWLTACAL